MTLQLYKDFYANLFGLVGIYFKVWLEIMTIQLYKDFYVTLVGLVGIDF